MQSTGGKVVFWIAISIVGLFIIGMIVVAVLTFRFLGSEEGKSILTAVQSTEEASKSAGPLLEGLEKYIQEKKTYPEEMSELRGYMPENAYVQAEKLFKYVKPEEDADENTVVFYTDKWSMMGEVYMWIEIRKDLEVYTVQETHMKDIKKKSRTAEPKETSSSLLLPWRKFLLADLFYGKTKIETKVTAPSF